jgi:hypothetical protein
MNVHKLSRWGIVSAVSAVGICTVWSSPASAAKPKTVDEVQQSLKEQYPDAKFEKTSSRNVNGVNVDEYNITTKDGTSTAQITQYGDFLSWGKPKSNSKGNALSPAAEDTLKGLFKGDVKDVTVNYATFYAIDLQTSTKSGKSNTFRLRFDPVGRLRAVKRLTGEVKAPGMEADLQKASGGDASKAEEWAKKYVKDASVEAVYSNPDDPDFYVVDMKGKDGTDEKIAVSKEGYILSRVSQEQKNDIPEPVTKAIDSYFNGEKISRVYREEAEFYDLEETAQAGGTVNIRISPNGDVMSVSNPQAAQEERAITAKHRESGSNSNDRDRDSGNKNKKK